MDKETLRSVQMIQLEIAMEIRRVCDALEIQYWLDFGTLLGAVRHKGFIPWDDDMDLGMFRSAYNEFLQKAPALLKEEYELISWNCDENYPHQFCKVQKKGTMYLSDAQAQDSIYGIYVDIFPYDKYPDDLDTQNKVKFQLKILRAVIRAKSHLKTWIVYNRFSFKKWLKNLPVRIISLFFKKQNLVAKYESICTSFNNANTCLFTAESDEEIGKVLLKEKALSSFITLPFEEEYFSVPKYYDEYLTTLYGDYMVLPPENERYDRHSIVKVEFGD